MKMLGTIILAASIAASILTVNANIFDDENLLQDERYNFVRQKIAQFPELQWLFKTKDNLSPDQHVIGRDKYFESWSFFIETNNAPEFNKTVASLYNLALIADGSDSAYRKFTAIQSDDSRLSLENFLILHSYIKEYLNFLPLIELNIVIRDLGKTQYVVDNLSRQCNLQSNDTHLLMEQILEKCPNIVQSYSNLDKSLKRKLKIVNSLHFGHFMNLEGGYEVLTKLKSYNSDYDDLTHALLRATVISEISAYKAHIGSYGSLSMDNNIFTIVQNAIEQIPNIKHYTEQEVLQRYVNYRQHAIGISQDSKHSNVVAKIASWNKIIDPERGKMLEDAFIDLPPMTQDLIIKHLDPIQFNAYRTPTYIPAMFDNIVHILNKRGASKYEIIEFIVHNGASFVAKVIEKHQSNPGTNQDYVISFKKAATQVLHNPDLLIAPEFIIQPDGIVLLRE